MKNRLIVPRVSFRGTSRKEFMNQRFSIIKALTVAIEALVCAAPCPWDYCPFEYFDQAVK